VCRLSASRLLQSSGEVTFARCIAIDPLFRLIRRRSDSWSFHIRFAFALLKAPSTC
jgi:hypothetical protein